jgi:hypothetical protein
MFLRRRPCPQEAPLLAQLWELEPEIRLHLSRMFPDVAQAVPLELQPLPVECAHWMVVASHLTRSGEMGNPFDWVVEELERPRTQDILDRYAGSDTRRAVRELADRARERRPDLRRPLCLLHRRFALYHVLVQGQRIYVFDLETRPAPGYPYEDLAHFTTYYDILFPWRRAAGIVRMSLAAQKRAFLDAYARHPSRLTEPEQAIMRFARLLAMVIYADDLEKEDSWRRRVRGWAGQPWYRHRFRLACRQELLALGESSGSGKYGALLP